MPKTVETYELPKRDQKLRANFYANRVVCEKATEIHAHDFVELAFVEAGSGMHQIGEETRPCTKGDLFLLNAAVKHRFIPERNGTLVICNCIFLPEFFDCSLIGSKSFQTLSNVFLFRSFFMEKISPSVEIHIPDNHYVKILTLIQEILAEYENRQAGYLELIRAYMLELIIYLLRKIETEKKYSIESSPNNEINFIMTQRVLSYIEEHFNDDLTIGDLSVLAFLSPAQFCRVFKQATGFTVKEIMQKTRVEVACKLLHDTNQTISKISSSVGYQDVKYFSKIFMRITGKTPSKMREEMRKI